MLDFELGTAGLREQLIKDHSPCILWDVQVAGQQPAKERSLVSV